MDKAFALMLKQCISAEKEIELKNICQARIASQSENELQSIFALHKHWFIADSIFERIRQSKCMSSSVFGTKESTPLDVASAFSFFSSLTVWYALLYVVVEGYREAGLIDSVIDDLLKEEKYIALLRRFRNSIFHFQKEADSTKYLEFLLEDDSDIWIHKLNIAFKNFFVSNLAVKEISKTII